MVLGGGWHSLWLPWLHHCQVSPPISSCPRSLNVSHACCQNTATTSPFNLCPPMNTNLDLHCPAREWLKRFFHRKGRDPIVILGLMLALLSYFLTFLTIPNSANMGETRMEAFVNPNSVLIVFIAFLIGFSDACFITQVPILGR